MKNIIKNNQGVIAILTLLSLSTFSLAIITTLALVAIDELRMTNAGGVIDETYYAAESGLNEALYRLIDDSSLKQYSENINGINVDIGIFRDPDNPYNRIVQATSTDSGGKVRVVRVIANTSSFAGGFDYAVQGGSGGIYMDNNSEVVGDVYANGNILPVSTSGSCNEVATISGNVTAAASSTLRRITVTGDALAGLIQCSDVAGDALSKAIDINTTVGGTWTEINYDAPIRTFPITNSDIEAPDGWKATKFGGATVYTADPSTCPASKPSGFYCIQNSGILGLAKIDTNFYIGNGATVTLDSPFIWVTGDLIFDNNGTVSISNDICSTLSDVVIIVDGKVDVSNNYTFNGCTDPNTGDVVQGIIIISTRGVDNVSNPDIYASNNSDSIIFSAINGLLKVKNLGNLNAAAAKTLYLEPNSTVTFNPFLAEFFVGSGGGEEIGTSLGTWQEL